MNSLEFVQNCLQSQPFDDPEAMEAAKIGVIDYLASSFLGVGTEDTEKLLDAFLDFHQGEALLLGKFIHTSPSFSALYNGFQAHIQDIDDVHADVRGHPSAVILSALLAVSRKEMSGQRFLSAYVVGVEVMARLGRALNPTHYEKGWHNTGTLGSIAAAAATAYLREWDAKTTARAMSIAATQSAGLRMQFGTPIKPLHAGFSARNAVESCVLAEKGMKAEEEFLFHNQGFLSVFGEEISKEPLKEIWKSRWAINDPGLWFKRYPFCSAAMAGADAAQILYQNHFFQEEEIEGVEIGFFPGKDAALVVNEPETGEEGRFSIEYISWLGLTGQPFSLYAFSPKALKQSLKHSLKKVSRYTLSSKEVPAYTEVKVTLKDKSVYKEQVTYPKGSPNNPLDVEDEIEKLALSISTKEQREKLLHQINVLDNHSLNGLLECLEEIKIG